MNRDAILTIAAGLIWCVAGLLVAAHQIMQMRWSHRKARAIDELLQQRHELTRQHDRLIRSLLVETEHDQGE